MNHNRNPNETDESLETPNVIEKARDYIFDSSPRTLGFATAIFSLTQYSVEVFNSVVLRTKESMLKFPNGISDINPMEEFLEGALPALVGGFTLAYVLYPAYAKWKGIDIEEDTRIKLIIRGSSLGYLGAVIILGPLLHKLTQSADFRLIQQLQELFH